MPSIPPYAGSWFARWPVLATKLAQWGEQRTDEAWRAVHNELQRICDETAPKS